MNTYDRLWRLNVVVYRMLVQRSVTKGRGPYTPKWLTEIDHTISEKRKFISKCVAERTRLSENGRIR